MNDAQTIEAGNSLPPPLGSGLDPLRQRMCPVVMVARRLELQAQARSFVPLKGFMPEITDPEDRYRRALSMVCEMWYFLGPQKDAVDSPNTGRQVRRASEQENP